MFAIKTLFRISVVVFPLLLCVSARAQENEKQRPSREVSLSNRTPEPSDLAKENLDRVAASAAQIKEVLAKEPGILVELKRWVAKEATDNGQIVEDSSLTDDAIFDRLEHDLQFRSLATRLVQRYGYLLPNVNPESAFAKEQDLVLKERARRLVQIEAQEDTESLRPGTGEDQDQKIQRTACDQRNQQNCAQPSSTRRSRGGSRSEDAGNPLCYLKANLEIALQDPRLRETLLHYVSDLHRQAEACTGSFLSPHDSTASC
jgi:hypothetical protein